MYSIIHRIYHWVRWVSGLHLLSFVCDARFWILLKHLAQILTNKRSVSFLLLWPCLSSDLGATQWAWNDCLHSIASTRTASSKFAPWIAARYFRVERLFINGFHGQDFDVLAKSDDSFTRTPPCRAAVALSNDFSKLINKSRKVTMIALIPNFLFLWIIAHLHPGSVPPRFDNSTVGKGL